MLILVKGIKVGVYVFIVTIVPFLGIDDKEVMIQVNKDVYDKVVIIPVYYWKSGDNLRIINTDWLIMLYLHSGIPCLQREEIKTKQITKQSM